VALKKAKKDHLNGRSQEDSRKEKKKTESKKYKFPRTAANSVLDDHYQQEKRTMGAEKKFLKRVRGPGGFSRRDRNGWRARTVPGKKDIIRKMTQPRETREEEGKETKGHHFERRKG